MKVKYLGAVDLPEHLAGTIGDVKDLSDNDAAQLIRDGVAVPFESQPKEPARDVADEAADSDE